MKTQVRKAAAARNAEKWSAFDDPPLTREQQEKQDADRTEQADRDYERFGHFIVRGVSNEVE